MTTYAKSTPRTAHSLALMAAIALTTNCTSDPDSEGGDGSETDATAGTTDGTDTDTGALECDIPQLFIDSCGGSICHSDGDSTAAELDLTSPGVEARVVGVPGNNCAGILANPAAPEQSLLYEKTADLPSCGARMPINGAPLTDEEQLCLRDWISGLLPPTGDGDGDPGDGDPGDGDGDPSVCEPGVTEACFSGPETSADVGLCASGMRTCADDGMSWGACEGEVLPILENCFTDNVDENCDGATPACTEQWILGFGDYFAMLPQSTRSAASDSNGDIFSVGDFEGTVSFGGAFLEAVLDKTDLVIAKHDRYGNHLWSQHYGDSSNQYGVKVIVDQNDDIIVVGRTYGNPDLGGGPLTSQGAGDILIAKFDGDGNHLWSNIYGDVDPDRSERVVIDSVGDVILTGTFTGEVDFGGGLFTSAGMRDAFLLKLEGDFGAHVFSLQIGGTGDDYGFGVDVNANDDILVSGRFGDTIDIAGPLVSAGAKDIFLAEFNSQGVAQWGKRFGGVGDDGTHDLAVQQNGDIVLVGEMSDSVSFGGPNLVSAGARDIFVAGLDASGNHQWSLSAGDAIDQFTFLNEVNSWLTLALAANGDIYIAGSLLGEVSFGGPSIAAASEDKPDIFYAQLGADGSFLAANRYGGIGTEIGLDISLADNGYMIIAGRMFGSSLDFGAAGSIMGFGSSDGVLVKKAP